MSRDNDIKEDRRVFERFRVNLPVSLIDLDAAKESTVQTRDVSAKGLGVVGKEGLSIGDRLELRLNIDDGKEPFFTKGCVVWSLQEETGNYRSGILLDKTELMGMSRIFKS